MSQQDEGDGEEFFIGGEKGHIRESIRGSVRDLFQRLPWKMIPNCTGRYTCRDHHRVATLPPLQLLESVGIETEAMAQYEICLPGRPDPIIIVPMDLHNTSGIIAYRKANSFVHTLNAVSGFRRKLDAIGIHVTDERIWYDGGPNS